MNFGFKYKIAIKMYRKKQITFFLENSREKIRKAWGEGYGFLFFSIKYRQGEKRFVMTKEGCENFFSGKGARTSF